MAIPESQMFEESKRLAPRGAKLSLYGELPGERAEKGDDVSIDVIAKDSQHERQIRLTKKLAEGGEGSVFKTSIKGYVAKVYQRDKLTSDRKEKLTRMISKKISYDGICFPEALILNTNGEFVGYLMQEAEGEELGRSVFQPQLLKIKFPNWTKRETVELSMTILKKIKYLNDRNVILGDINPANILVRSPTKVYFVDCDSYQIEGYPCPVGTATFTAPEAQGRDFKTFLRTQYMENFAIATLLFMIMLCGKPPYSVVDGGSPEKNIKDGVFAYPHKDTETDKTPPGRWGYIWSHMSYKMRLAFYETFKKGEKHFAPQNRYNADEWLEQFKDYKYALGQMVKNDEMSIMIMPTREKKKKCKECGNFYVPDRDNYTPYCPSCDAKHNRTSRSMYATTTSASGYGRSSSTSYGRSTTSNKKLCPYCNKQYIPNSWSYCNSCKTKVVKYRECVNCHQKFPVTVSLEAWEKSHNATRKQCDVCREAGCTADPCRHALKTATQASPSTSKIQGTQKAKTQKSSTSGDINWGATIGGFFGGVFFGWMLWPILLGGPLYLFGSAVGPMGDAIWVLVVIYVLICGSIGGYIGNKKF